jgi:hypothetical protein
MLRTLNISALSGGYVAAGVYRLDLQFDDATYSFVQKHTNVSEIRAMKLLGDATLPEIPHLISDSISAGEPEQAPTGCFVTPFYAGHALDWDDDIPLSVIKTLAAVHAAYRTRVTEIDWLPQVNTAFIEGMVAYVLDTLDKNRERVPEAEAEVRSHLAQTENLPVLQAAFDRLPKTLTHGDVHSGNILRREDDSYVLFDWGNARIAPGMLDLANMVEYGSDDWAAYLQAWADLTGEALSDELARLGYAWATAIVQLQYLPFAIGYLDADAVLGMVEKRRSAIRQLQGLLTST